MSFLKRSSTPSDDQSSPTGQPDSKITSVLRRQDDSSRIMRGHRGNRSLRTPWIRMSSRRPASSLQHAASTVDPDAVDAVKKMGAYLRSLKAFQVIGNITHDDVLDDGLIVKSDSKVDMLVATPNRMRVEVTSDEKDRIYFYDGKNFTIFAKLVNYYATAPAPPTIVELFKKAEEKYDIDLPLIDLFKWGTNEDDINKIKTAVDVGPATVEGVTCEQYAFHQEGVDWQIWIQLGQYPLPRRLVITTLTDDARPQHSITMSWNLAPSFNDEAFTFYPPEDAKRIILEGEKPHRRER